MRPDLRAELLDAGLDPDAVLAHVRAGLEEDLPGDSVDVTSTSTIPTKARSRVASPIRSSPRSAPRARVPCARSSRRSRPTSTG